MTAPAIDTPLGIALREHRATCPACTDTRGCLEYLAITNRATAARRINEGRLNVAYSWLSIREAEAGVF